MSRTEPTLVVIDDEPAIIRFLKAALQANGYRVLEALTAEEGLRAVRHEKPDAVILDLGLPDREGLEVLAEIRERDPLPVIVLSSRADERVKVAALDAGADDYITKPFGIDELMARVRTALRHRFAEQGAAPIFRSGELEVDLVRRTVRVRGADVRLSPKEYDILEQLVVHAGKVLTHRHLLREVWGGESAVDVQYLRIYVRQLRQKLEPDVTRPTYILTESGVGYRLAVDN